MKKELTLLLLVAVTVCSISCEKTGLEVPHDPPFPPLTEKKWVVTTIAGNGAASFIDGDALSATFHFPEDLAVADDAAIYVTDVANSVIRELAADQLSTFAGSGQFGISDGNGKSAKFQYPFSIALDHNGNIYTTDENDPRIRKISSAGIVTTYAGFETPGFADGNANESRFSLGNYITADAIGNLYVSDGQNNRIRKVSITGQVTTIAGSGIAGFNDGNGSTSQFDFPGGIAIDFQDNLYVVDRGNFRIRKISPTGNVSTIAGNGTQGSQDGKANEAQFTLDMRDIIIDGDGNLFLSEGNRLRKISSQGVVSTIAGNSSGYQDGDGPSAKFNYPNGLSIDMQGNIYVADLNNNRIRKVSFE